MQNWQWRNPNTWKQILTPRNPSLDFHFSPFFLRGSRGKGFENCSQERTAVSPVPANLFFGFPNNMDKNEKWNGNEIRIWISWLDSTLRTAFSELKSGAHQLLLKSIFWFRVLLQNFKNGISKSKYRIPNRTHPYDCWQWYAGTKGASVTDPVHMESICSLGTGRKRHWVGLLSAGFFFLVVSPTKAGRDGRPYICLYQPENFEHLLIAIARRTKRFTLF